MTSTPRQSFHFTKDERAFAYPITMRAFLGLLFCSVLLTTVASLECDVCSSSGKTCTHKETCPHGTDTCMSMLTESRSGSGQFSIAKSCVSKDICKQQVELAKTQQQTGGPVLTVQCSKAPASAGSLILALSGLILMKIFV